MTPSFTLHFPPDFRWGTATASHQVEGGNTNNNWHAWEQQANRIANGDKSGLACDFWNLAEADIDRMAELGLNAHRLSIEWSRVEPRAGQFDEAALARYRDIVVYLRNRGIEPMITLHHFTNPLWLEEQGGLANAAIAVPAFERFAERVVLALGDVCDLWCTINEPNVFAVMGNLAGRMPPGLQGDFGAALRVVCTMLVMHVAATRIIRHAQPQARVGFAHHMRDFQPLRRGNPLDHAAARIQDLLFNSALLDSLLRGRWHIALRRYAPDMPLATGTLDWLGLNYYTRQATRFVTNSRASGFGSIENFPGAVMSDFDYGEIYPEGLLRMLRRLSKTRLPVYVTENGLPDHDDDQRPGFLISHLREVWKAVQFCFDVRGYYHWTFVDNFEWSEGWRMKFGLYAMDLATRERTLRPSGALYGEIARAGAITDAMVSKFAPELFRTLFRSGAAAEIAD
jgi:beta-glucosidase